MKSLSGGIDIGSESHHVIIMDDTGEVLYDRKVAHQFSEFHKVIGEFKGIEEREQGVIAFAIEGKNGYGVPFDRILIEKVRIQSRLRKRLLEVCPDILEHGDTNSKKLLQLLRKYPDFSRYKKITLGALLKIETIGKKTAVSILEGLRNIQYVEELTGIYKALISSYCHRILELKEEIKMLDRELEEAGQKSAEVMQLKSIKGVGTKLSSRLAGEIGDIRRFNRKKHNHALRCLARQLIKVIFKMLTENREYIYKEELKKAA